MLVRVCFVFCLAGGILIGQSPHLRSNDGENKYLGNVNANQFDPDSIANPFGRYGSQFSPDSVNNPFGTYGSPYSPYSAQNPYTTQAPKVVTPNGAYLGNYSANPYDSNSIGNRFGTYGSPYSPQSIANPYGVYGSPYSSKSATNPYGSSQFRFKPAMPILLALPRLPLLPEFK